MFIYYLILAPSISCGTLLSIIYPATFISFPFYNESLGFISVACIFKGE